MVIAVKHRPRAEAVLDDLERIAEEWDGKGVKLGSIHQHFKPDAEEHFPVYEGIQALGLVILWHQATSFDARKGPLEWANPALLDQVARAFPNSKMIIAHFRFLWTREVVALVRKPFNVYSDISPLRHTTWILYDALVNLVQYGGRDKVFLGSDYPWFTPTQEREGLREASRIPQGTKLPPLGAEAVAGILHRD
jgi:hypothetical protein